MTTPKNELGSLAKEFRCALEARLSGDTNDQYRLAGKDGVNEFCCRYLEALFPLYYAPGQTLEPLLAHFVGDLESRLREQIVRAMHFDCTCQGKKAPENVQQSAEGVVKAIWNRLPHLAHWLATDLQAALKNDPAASGLEEILLSYPGVEAITVQRFAHELYKLKVPYLPRILTELAHSRTGIDIHPGATIDDSFFIDHGTGVVIGETAVIGRNVRLYQAVTLGAKRFEVDASGTLIKNAPRHPIVEDDVVIYAGATILGRVTIGKGSSIGGNVWLTHSVPPGSTITQAKALSESFGGGAGI
jgi:serine O-acetyltransferase